MIRSLLMGAALAVSSVFSPVLASDAPVPYRMVVTIQDASPDQLLFMVVQNIDKGGTIETFAQEFVSPDEESQFVLNFPDDLNPTKVTRLCAEVIDGPGKFGNITCLVTEGFIPDDGVLRFEMDPNDKFVDLKLER